MRLIVAEKPSAAQDFATALGARFNKDTQAYECHEYRIVHLRGHLLALKGLQELYEVFQGKWDRSILDHLPVFPDLAHKSMYKVTDQALLKTVTKHLLDPAIDTVINACDPGREGELLFWEVYQYAGCDKPVLRFWESESLSRPVVLRGLQNLKGPDFWEPRRKAAYARQQADWYVGMNLTVAYSAMAGTLYSVGPVQTPTLALVVGVDDAIENFPSIPYAEIEVYFPGFTARYKPLAPKYPDHPYSLDEKEAQEWLEYFLQCQTARVESIETTSTTVAPPLLYSLTTLQVDANRKFGFSASATLKIAQKLYDEHYLSYPRTDSEVIGDSMLTMVNTLAQQLAQHYGFQYGELHFTERNVNNAKLTDHHALLPLKPLPETASESEKKIYNLVLIRFFQAFGLPGMDQKIKVTLKVVNTLDAPQFEATGRVQTEPGWRQLGHAPSQDEEDNQVHEALFKLRQGQVLKFVDRPKLLHKTIEPPKRYTEATLLKAMANIANTIQDEELRQAMKAVGGRLGTPATQAAIIDLLLRRGYLQKKKKSLISTPLGRAVIATVAPELRNAVQRARMEQLLNDFTNPDAVDTYLKDVFELVQRNVSFCKKADSSFLKLPKVGVACPFCDAHADIVDKGRLYACANTDCSFKIPKVYNGYSLKPKDIQDLVTHGHTTILTFKTKDGRRTYQAKLVLDGQRVSIAFPTVEERSLGSCPMCTDGIVYSKTPKICGCNRCDWVLFRTVAGVNLTDAQIRRLLDRKSIPNIKGFKKKDGTTFAAGLQLDEKGAIRFTKSNSGS
ncbi:type IA DNA topoisomerase [Alicyclobacillus macrosporangiidus]|uniref:DNA topoisomerase n=1 Tax=Alicyclobacillus macrosporangiidus TaxID=392015 RepID=A0A1I7L296_9BACL|nr:type IA DNA topoisomerase [Alicyclobacillus macrosporangiidus]SFV03850.1 DNA topoisomerase-3 [Alicyclobacillus macrosporangiidus]